MIRIHVSINTVGLITSLCSKSKANIPKITVLHCIHCNTFVVNTYFMILFSYIVDCRLLVYFASYSLFYFFPQTNWLIDLFFICSIIICSCLLQHFTI